MIIQGKCATAVCYASVIENYAEAWTSLTF